MRRKDDKLFESEFEEINFARVCAGLKPLKIKEKRCNKCSKTFKTTTHDISCKECKQNYSYVSSQFSYYM